MANIDPIAFRVFEYRGWEQSVAAYDRYFGPLTRQTIAPLLDAARVAATTQVLDVASGPGYVAAAAQARGAEVVAIDFSERMVAAASEQYHGIDFRHGDAEALAFAARTFDAVVMNFGILHLGRPDTALRECWRVLRTGRRLGFTVWCEPGEARGFAIVLRAIEAHGDPHIPLPAGPPFFRFSNEHESRNALEQAGFDAVSIVKLPMIWELRSPDELVDAFLHGTARTGGLLRAQQPAALAAIREAVAQSCQAYEVDGALRIPMPALVVSGEARP